MDAETLQAALAGFKIRLAEIDARMSAIYKQLASERRGQPFPLPKAVQASPPQKKRRLSPATRKKIADAQRLRWAKVRNKEL